jgi:hypothetical protein
MKKNKITIGIIFFTLVVFQPRFSYGFNLNNFMSGVEDVTNQVATKALEALISKAPENIDIKYNKIDAKVTKGFFDVFGLTVYEKYEKERRMLALKKLSVSGVDVIKTLSGNEKEITKVGISEIMFKSSDKMKNFYNIFGGGVQKLELKNISLPIKKEEKEFFIKSLNVENFMLKHMKRYSDKDKIIGTISAKNIQAKNVLIPEEIKTIKTIEDVINIYDKISFTSLSINGRKISSKQAFRKILEK